MAPPRPRASQTHQTGQGIILRQLLEALRTGAWPLFDSHDIKATTPRLSTAILALVHRYGPAASVHAATFYKQQRAAAGVTSRFVVPVAPTPTREVVQPQVEWATSDLYGKVTPEAERATLTKIEGVATKLVLDQSRATVLDAVKKDPKAKGWARVPEPGACSFCLMLATRGAVYRSQETANFRSHDHCQCHIEPLFGSSYEPTAVVRAAQNLYNASARTGPSDPLNNFRMALQRERDAGRFPG